MARPGVPSRWTSHPRISADCPVCDGPLPQVVVDVDARTDGDAVTLVDVRVQELDAAWWDAAEQMHPGCGVRRAQQAYLDDVSRRTSRDASPSAGRDA